MKDKLGAGAKQLGANALGGDKKRSSSSHRNPPKPGRKPPKKLEVRKQ
jgi:hypothetical protein